MPASGKGLLYLSLDVLSRPDGHNRGLPISGLTLTVRFAQFTSVVTMLWSFQYRKVWLFGFSGSVHLQLEKDENIPNGSSQLITKCSELCLG